MKTTFYRQKTLLKNAWSSIESTTILTTHPSLYLLVTDFIIFVTNILYPFYTAQFINSISAFLRKISMIENDAWNFNPTISSFTATPTVLRKVSMQSDFYAILFLCKHFRQTPLCFKLQTFLCRKYEHHQSADSKIFEK